MNTRTLIAATLLATLFATTAQAQYIEISKGYRTKTIYSNVATAEAKSRCTTIWAGSNGRAYLYEYDITINGVTGLRVTRTTWNAWATTQTVSFNGELVSHTPGAGEDVRDSWYPKGEEGAKWEGNTHSAFYTYYRVVNNSPSAKTVVCTWDMMNAGCITENHYLAAWGSKTVRGPSSAAYDIAYRRRAE